MKRTIAIIGGGPSAFMLAAILDEKLFDISIYDRNFAFGRKFLVAGDGGFNLTHSEPLEQLIQRYTPPSFLEKALRSFSNNDLREWLKELGIETYIGTSKRVFPIKGIKPIAVLNAILGVLHKKSVQFKTRHTWSGWDSNNGLKFVMPDNNIVIVNADIVVFALGGCSWAKTGSDGTWNNLFEMKGIEIIPFQPSNCAFHIEWDKKFIENAEGKPLKNIQIACGGFEKKGELVITKSGLEGGAIYALSHQIRQQLKKDNLAIIDLDLKPELSVSEIKSKLINKGKQSLTEILKNDLNLSEIKIKLLKTILPKDDFLTIDKLAINIKTLSIQINGMAPIDEAISTVGGISLNETDENFQLKKRPGSYAIGEMLDWDAPTGGYLLQGCFSMGHSLAIHLNS